MNREEHLKNVIEIRIRELDEKIGDYMRVTIASGHLRAPLRGETQARSERAGLEWVLDRMRGYNPTLFIDVTP